jgi:hypothetical protein
MKKGKIISMPTGTDAQIRTRARNLPLGKCYVCSNWENTQTANVVVTRKHVNGNVTFGFYTVDLMLLGVKYCYYAFNESPAELDERLNSGLMEFVECDYVLAHNIIYEGIAFAEDYGFEPVKSFTKTGIYILEEDLGNIPEMDIPLGEDGIPVVLVTPNDSRRRELAILDKTAGSDNFIVYEVDDKGNIIDDEYDDDDDDEYDDDEDYGYYEYVAVDILNIGIDRYAAEYKDDMSPIQVLALTDVAYQTLLGNLDFHKLEETMELILDDDRYEPDLNRLSSMEPYSEELGSIIDKLSEDEDAALAEMDALVTGYPDEPDLSVFYIDLLRDLDMTPEVKQKIQSRYERAGSHYAVRLSYAGWLIEQERYDEVFELFGNRPGLDALTTEDVPFTDMTVAEFCTCYTLIWLAKGNIEEAEPYYRVLIKLNISNPRIKNTLLAMMNKKKDALLEKSKDRDKDWITGLTLFR